MAETLWGHEHDWPVNPINFVFLLRTTDQVGRAMFGDEWHRPSFDPADRNSARHFQRVIETIAQACETGDLPAAFQQGDGEMVTLEARDWHAKDWKYYFVDGDIEVPASYFESFEHEQVVTSWKKCPIFIRRESLDRFIAKIQSETAGEPQSAPAHSGFPGRPSSSQLVDGELERRIVTLKQGQFLGANIKEVAGSLSDWLKVTHPSEPQATAKSIGNRLGSKIRRHVPAPARN
jgi:hypothetical protein